MRCHSSRGKAAKGEALPESLLLSYKSFFHTLIHPRPLHYNPELPERRRQGLFASPSCDVVEWSSKWRAVYKRNTTPSPTYVGGPLPSSTKRLSSPSTYRERPPHTRPQSSATPWLSRRKVKTPSNRPASLTTPRKAFMLKKGSWVRKSRLGGSLEHGCTPTRPARLLGLETQLTKPKKREAHPYRRPTRSTAISESIRYRERRARTYPAPMNIYLRRR